VIVTKYNCNSRTNKCNHPIQNPSLFVTEPRSRDAGNLDFLANVCCISDDAVMYSPADLNQIAEYHQQQEGGDGLAMGWP
jgi:hypothetical protein